jgi:outer membrane receptor protein involved in Fe transport
VAANTKADAPKTLRMRLRARPHVAQAAPDPAPASDTPPAGDATQPPAPTPDAAPPAPTPPAGPAAPEQPAPELTDAELAKLAEQEAKTEVITVTGSLIGRKEVDSPSPIAVVDREKMSAAGVTNVGDILQKIPAQGNALNAQNNNGGDGSTRIDLRSLGSKRTLVLLNGRRIVPSGLGADESVDISTIPLAMIERVEILKDGASAVYGSDAIAGVVNIITRTNFNGTDATAYTSTSQKGDGSNYDLSFVSGRTTAKGNITFAAGYQNQQAIMAGDRGFAATTSTYNYGLGQGPPSGLCDTQAQIDSGACVIGGTVLAGSTSGATGQIGTKGFPNKLGCMGNTCTADLMHPGLFRDFVSATPTSFNDAYNFQTENYVLTPSSRVHLFSNGSYELAKNTQAFYEASYNNRTSTQQLAEEPLVLQNIGVTLSKDSIGNPFGSDITAYRRRLTEFGPRTANQNVDTSRVVVGLKGSLDEELPVVKNWKWETSYNYGRNTSTQTLHGDLIVSRVANALGPSFTDVTGDHCGTPSAVIDGCVPLKLLTPGQVSKAAIDYTTFTSIQSGLNEEHTALATLSGKLVELPNHGDISVAVGADYRLEKGANQPDPLTAIGDTTGNANAPTSGSYHAYEGFGELSIVPVSGLEYVKWVEVDAAARAYKYNVFGSGVTGKLSGLVRTVGGLAARGTFGSAFRAPTVNELFGGQADSFFAVPDPCNTADGTKVLAPVAARRCAEAGVPTDYTYDSPQIRGKIGGNTALKAETATNFTTGIVYEPPQVKGLDFTLDYWHIDITNALQTLQPSVILAGCYSGDNDGFCKQVQRENVTHTIDHLVDIFQNVGKLQTSGLDFSAAYLYRNDLGTFRHSFEGTYLFKYNIDTGSKDLMGNEVITHGKGFYDLGVNPDLKFNIFTQWTHPSGIGAGVNFRFVDKFQECYQNDCNTASNLRRTVPRYYNGDLFVNYALKSSQGTTNVSVGMNNVANVQPPAIYNGAALNADESAYDFLGRQFYVRLGQLF